MRAFIAIELPEAIRNEMFALGLKMPGRISRVAADNIHITLQFLGEISERDATLAIKAIKGISSEQFNAEAKGISYFRAKKIHTVYAKITDSGRVVDTYSEIQSRFSNLGIKVDQDRQYVPHATIARVKQEDPELSEFIDQNSSHYFGRFKVTSICMIKSVLTGKEPAYTKIFEQNI